LRDAVFNALDEAEAAGVMKFMRVVSGSDINYSRSNPGDFGKVCGISIYGDYASSYTRQRILGELATVQKIEI